MPAIERGRRVVGRVAIRQLALVLMICSLTVVCLAGCIFPAYHVLYKPMTQVGKTSSCSPCSGSWGYIFNNNCRLELADKGYTLEIELSSSHVNQMELYFYLKPEGVSARGDLTKVKMKAPNGQARYPSQVLRHEYGKSVEEAEVHITGATEFCPRCFYLIRFDGGMTTGQQVVLQFDEASLEVGGRPISLEDIPIWKKRVLDIFLFSGINC